MQEHGMVMRMDEVRSVRYECRYAGAGLTHYSMNDEESPF